MALVAVVAGGGADLALRLGASMTALQCSIGALNDIIDAPADAGRTPPKPIPAGTVSSPAAWAAVVILACLGIWIATTIGSGVAVLAGVVLLIGYAYDLFAKGTPWSWLPFAIGIPILPVYGWYGTTGSLPTFFTALIPMAVLAGAGLAIGNARSDIDSDRAFGTSSVATALGDERAWVGELVLLAASALLAIGWLVVEGADLPAVSAAGVAALVLTAAVVAAQGAGRRRRWAWELEAVAVAGALVVWLAVLPETAA